VKRGHVSIDTRTYRRHHGHAPRAGERAIWHFTVGREIVTIVAPFRVAKRQVRERVGRISPGCMTVIVLP